MIYIYIYIYIPVRGRIKETAQAYIQLNKPQCAGV